MAARRICSHGAYGGAATSSQVPPHAALAPHALERAHDPIDRGRRLFVAKGCVTCHVHADAGRPTLAPLAPDLTHKRFDAAYLRLYLANPAIRPPTRRDGFAMPNLGLKSAEIIPLVAFLDAETRAGTQQGRR
jgi:cytochrome c2